MLHSIILCLELQRQANTIFTHNVWENKWAIAYNRYRLVGRTDSGAGMTHWGVGAAAWCPRSGPTTPSPHCRRWSVTPTGWGGWPARLSVGSPAVPRPLTTADWRGLKHADTRRSAKHGSVRTLNYNITRNIVTLQLRPLCALALMRFLEAWME